MSIVKFQSPQQQLDEFKALLINLAYQQPQSIAIMFTDLIEEAHKACMAIDKEELTTLLNSIAAIEEE